MITYSKNHYILGIQSNYTREIRWFDMYNKSCDPRYYLFEDFEWPSDMPRGEYDFVLFWCMLDYTIKTSGSLLESEITVNTIEGNDETFTIKDLIFETGMIDSKEDQKEPLTINKQTEFYSL